MRCTKSRLGCAKKWWGRYGPRRACLSGESELADPYLPLSHCTGPPSPALDAAAPRSLRSCIRAEESAAGHVQAGDGEAISALAPPVRHRSMAGCARHLHARRRCHLLLAPRSNRARLDGGDGGRRRTRHAGVRRLGRTPGVWRDLHLQAGAGLLACLDPAAGRDATGGVDAPSSVRRLGVCDGPVGSGPHRPGRWLAYRPVQLDRLGRRDPFSPEVAYGGVRRGAGRGSGCGGGGRLLQPGRRAAAARRLAARLPGPGGRLSCQGDSGPHGLCARCRGRGAGDSTVSPPSALEPSRGGVGIRRSCRRLSRVRLRVGRRRGLRAADPRVSSEGVRLAVATGG